MRNNLDFIMVYVTKVTGPIKGAHNWEIMAMCSVSKTVGGILLKLGIWSLNVTEHIGGQASRKETTGKTKTWVGGQY
jgi:hypothetical protein